MKFKFLMTLGLLLTALTGCSEGTYAPTAMNPQMNGWGQNGFQTGFNNGFNNNGFNNNGFNNNGFNNNGFNNNGFNNGFNNGMFQNPCAGNMAQMYFNPYIYNPCQLSLAQMQIRAQLLSSWSFRMNPNFYYQMSPGSTCAIQRYPDFTPSRCECFKAPCDCNRIVRRHRRVYRENHYRYYRRTSCRTCVTYGSGSGYSKPKDDETSIGEAKDDSKTDAGENDANNGSELRYSFSSHINEMDGPSAQAVWNRLELEATPVPGDSDTEQKIGKGLTCIKFNKKPDGVKNEYVCRVTLTSENGGTLHYEPNTLSKFSTPNTSVPSSISDDIPGSMIHLYKANGKVAQFILSGDGTDDSGKTTNPSKDLFDALSKGKSLSPDENNVITVDGKQFRCYRDTRLPNPYYCEVRFSIGDGTPIPPAQWNDEDYQIYK
ncbi:MAG: hypothetical protein KGP28_05240 [Bdellovibrionales bacterium]|nr:hypothetical protein [Bdellovibrionales bacterium]